MLNKGLAIHCHHDTLIEYCYDYNERVDYIKANKPPLEQKIRLKLFKLLPEEAILELPEGLVNACAEWDKACAEWDKAYAEWDIQSQLVWHKKWCGCSEWNGKEIVFR